MTCTFIDDYGEEVDMLHFTVGRYESPPLQQGDEVGELKDMYK
jgi:hypothetical protein